MAEQHSLQESGRRDAPAQGTARSPPTLDGLPVLDHTLSLLRGGVEFGDSVAAHGDVVRFDAMGMPFVAVYDPELVQQVLVDRNDEFRKGDYETSLGELVAPRGLAFTEGEQWRRDRQLLQPAFTPRHVQSFADTMVARTASAADDWAAEGTVDLRESASALTLDILVGTLFDIDLDAERGQVVREAMSALADRISGASTMVPEWLPTPAKRRFDRRMAALDEMVEALVRERRAGDGPGSRDDLLDTLLAAEYPDGSTMDAEHVRDQLVTFLMAGHETTAVALTYILWLLAGDSTVRDRLDAEIATVCGGSDPTFADLPALEVAEAVVNEALRLYPPVYAIYRQPVADTVLGGYELQEDQTLILGTYQIHRDDRWWDDPERFRPERWLDAGGGEDEDGEDENGEAADAEDRPEYAYFPFGGGPRHCIGMRFARMELQLALVTLARRLDFERVTETVEPSAKVTLDPGTVRLRVRDRR
ncbi:cytochrome P450 [Haloarchaeobius amylolyticus]|uniref:cytochrome P450 n=1 Tax=Haloarchaeobius amylolyticus TaxID=1198296 RepID=UPI00226EEE66|nr:cytochrome P450 [Haloarchaeobius amylolyticus]